MPNVQEKPKEPCKESAIFCFFVQGPKEWSRSELAFFNEDFKMILNQVTFHIVGENQTFRVSWFEGTLSLWEFSTHKPADNIPESEMLTNNCPLVI